MKKQKKLNELTWEEKIQQLEDKCTEKDFNFSNLKQELNELKVKFDTNRDHLIKCLQQNDSDQEEIKWLRSVVEGTIITNKFKFSNKLGLDEKDFT